MLANQIKIKLKNKKGRFFIRFIDFMLKVKSLLDSTNLFSPNNYQKNHKILSKLFNIEKGCRDSYVAFFPVIYKI